MMSKLTERSGRILFYFFLEETPSDFVVFRSTLDADLSCGKNCMGIFGIPVTFFWLCYHLLQF